MENARFCLGAQQLRIPFPHLPLPGAQGPTPYMGPPGPLPARRQGSFMVPGRSRRNKIQAVSQVTDWGGGSPDSRAQLGDSWGSEQLGQI